MFGLKITQEHKRVHHLLSIDCAIPIAVKKCEERSCSIFTFIFRDIPSQKPLVEFTPANLLVGIVVYFAEDMSLTCKLSHHQTLL